MSERIGPYMIAFQRPRARGRKTDIWAVSDLHEGDLGEVRWLGRWRQYVFDPSACTSFNAGCLRDMVAFLERVNSAHKRQRRDST